MRLSQHREDEALEAYDRGLAAAPRGERWFAVDPKELYEMGTLALTRNRPELALRFMQFRRTMDRPMPETGGPWCVLAEAERRLGEDATEAGGRCR